MIYKFRPSEKKHEKGEIRSLRRAGRDCPRKQKEISGDEIDLTSLFDANLLCGECEENHGRSRKIKSKAVFKKGLLSVWVWICAAGKSIKKAFVKGALAIKNRLGRAIERRKARRVLPSVIPLLSGALAGALTVSFLSGAIVVYKLFIKDYFGAYSVITIPEMRGLDYAKARELLDGKDCNISVSYEYSEDAPYGVVIKHNPRGLAERKVFFREELPTVSIVVSRGKESFVMEDLTGERGRDAALRLKNLGAAVVINEEYSDTVEAGRVILTNPPADESFFKGQSVKIVVSVGKKKEFARAPSIVGISENRAVALIEASGLRVGEVKYVASEKPMGIVISQEKAPYSELEYGESLSFTVSGGGGYTDKKIPSLYGLTLDEAKELLLQNGLLCGAVYSTQSSEPVGTVVSQSPSAQSVINSTTITVDIYISS